MFRQKCEEFLSSLTSMRTAAIQKAVAEAVNTVHIPFVEKVTEETRVLIDEERKKTEELIANLKKESEARISKYNSDTKQAIDKHKVMVSEEATKTAKANYDTFILGVSQLIDKTNI